MERGWKRIRASARELDDPRYVRDGTVAGATPPSVYKLTPREQLFHGVQALRLTPVSGNVYGRAGLLAHTYMLGPNGNSNGCVSFRNYQAFLQAYQNGEVERLAVVASMNYSGWLQSAKLNLLSRA